MKVLTSFELGLCKYLSCTVLTISSLNLLFGSLMEHKQNGLWFKAVRKCLIALNLGKE